MKLAELKTAEFVDLLASDAPAPGGGSAAALEGALGAALTAFLHGAQDGQKFLGVLALILTLKHGGYALHLWESLACAALMALGTLMGGRRIIDTVGRRLVTLEPRSGFAAEAGCALTLALCTLWGFPVSTRPKYS